MAARPDCTLDKIVARPKTVQAGQTVSRGRVVKYGGTDSEILQCAAGDRGMGVAMEDGIAGQLISIALLDGGGVHPVVVGTGGATRGSSAITVANGVATSAALGGGTVAREICGTFTQTGVAGDLVGMTLIPYTGVSA